MAINVFNGEHRQVLTNKCLFDIDIFRTLKLSPPTDNDFYAGCTFIKILPFEEQCDGVLACAQIIRNDRNYSICLLKLNFKTENCRFLDLTFTEQKHWGYEMRFAENDPMIFIDQLMPRFHHERVRIYKVSEESGKFKGKYLQGCLTFEYLDILAINWMRRKSGRV
jgi:hypothetical protein